MLQINGLEQGLDIFKCLGSEIRMQIVDLLAHNHEMNLNEMAAALIEQLEKSGAAKSAYLRGIRQNGVSGYLLIIDINEGGEEKIAALPQAILPLTEGVPITLVKYKSEFGRQAAQGQEPFYQKVIIES